MLHYRQSNIERSFFISFQWNVLSSFPLSLSCNKKPTGNSSSMLQHILLLPTWIINLLLNCVVYTFWRFLFAYICMHDIVKTLRIPLQCGSFLKWPTLLFLTYSTPNFSPPSLHPSLSSLSSLRLSPLYSNQNQPIPPFPIFYLVLSVNADIIYQHSSCRLISQHKSLSPVHPSLTLHPLPPPPLCPQHLFTRSPHSVCDK